MTRSEFKAAGVKLAKHVSILGNRLDAFALFGKTAEYKETLTQAKAAFEEMVKLFDKHLESL